MRLGSLVFKEASGYRAFYHRLLKPFQHYVPFWEQRPQELLDALGWAETHPREAEAIGQAGQELAVSLLTLESLQCYWVQLLQEYSRLLRYTCRA